MMGLPESGEYRYSASPIPGSTLVLEFMEFRGVHSVVVKPRVQDPGAYRLQLNVDDVGATIDALKNSRSTVISTGGKPVRMTFGRPWLLAAVLIVSLVAGCSDAKPAAIATATATSTVVAATAAPRVTSLPATATPTVVASATAVPVTTERRSGVAATRTATMSAFSSSGRRATLRETGRWFS